MARIATLTLNPAIDVSSQTEAITPTRKLRTSAQHFAPGGGGLNVARVLARLGAPATALYLAGGLTGPLLLGLVERSGIAHHALPIAGDTRISLTVQTGRDGLEYRFVPEGPMISAAEAAAVLAHLDALDTDWLVLSGSLPRGLPEDFYAAIIKRAHRRQIGIVLDTSGKALAAALAAGGVRLVKPNLVELAAVAGKSLEKEGDIIAAARAIVDAGGAERVAVSMAEAGAILVTADGHLRLPALPATPVSTVGAGDSFVAAMTYGLARGWTDEQAFRLGIAAGTAAILTPGTDLCQRRDIARLARLLGIASLD